MAFTEMNLTLTQMVRSRAFLCAFTLVTIACIGLSCARSDRMQKIGDEITISTEWTEIRPPRPLRHERNINVVELFLADGFSPDLTAHGVRLRDGTIVIPAVQLVDQDSKTYEFGVFAFTPNSISFRMPEMDVPSDKVYPVVRIRSPREIKCSSVFWRSYNQQDR
jgi:hypothetical protein